MSKHSRKYSVSGDDLERADSLGLASSYQPVSSYSAPVNNLDSLAAKTEAAQDVAEARDGAGGHHHHGHHAEHAAAPAPAAAAASTSYQVNTGMGYPTVSVSIYAYISIWRWYSARILICLLFCVWI